VSARRGGARPASGERDASALRWHARPHLEDPTMLLAFEGWNDAGEAASLAARYVSDELGTAPLAEIDPDRFFDFTVQRPEVQMDEGGARSIQWPIFELRFGSLRKGRDVVVGIGPEPHLRWHEYGDLLVAHAAELGVQRVALLGAYLADVVYSRPVALSGFASNPEWLGELSVGVSRYEGPTGIVGVLGQRFQDEGLDVVSLWAGLPHYINATPNPRGALALLQALAACLELKLDEAPLVAQAAEYERRTNELVSSDPELAEYVRELKRREFAQ
jgi:predicted ATP-grasp superfamily ATP-dependent carboligase